MLKPGDKVICIYNTVLDHLTYGKEYIVYKETTDDIVCIYNDNTLKFNIFLKTISILNCVYLVWNLVGVKSV